MGKGERRKVERGKGNGERGKGNRERGMGKGERRRVEREVEK